MLFLDMLSQQTFNSTVSDNARNLKNLVSGVGFNMEHCNELRSLLTSGINPSNLSANVSEATYYFNEILKQYGQDYKFTTFCQILNDIGTLQSSKVVISQFQQYAQMVQTQVSFQPSNPSPSLTTGGSAGASLAEAFSPLQGINTPTEQKNPNVFPQYNAYQTTTSATQTLSNNQPQQTETSSKKSVKRQIGQTTT